MSFEMQVASHVDPKRKLVLARLRATDGPWLTLCCDVPVEGCLYHPIRYEEKRDAEAMLNKLYPELAPKDKQVVLSQSVTAIPDWETH